ncbi:MAG: hypothetical protein ABR575_07670 [Actinomycetota bacterium]
MSSRHMPDVNPALAARGGLSWGAVLTGVVVAFGSMVILSALVTALLAALGVIDIEAPEGDALSSVVGAGTALVLAQLLSYLWGGYAAGRMARGAGLLNGLLVALLAVLISIAVAAVVTSAISEGSLEAAYDLEPPFTRFGLDVQGADPQDWGIGIGIAAVVAMFVGAAVGGLTGARWHTRLERDAFESRQRETDAGQTSRPPVATSAPDTTGTTTGTAAPTPAAGAQATRASRSSPDPDPTAHDTPPPPPPTRT